MMFKENNHNIQKEMKGFLTATQDFTNYLRKRHRTTNIWRNIFRASTVIGVIFLTLLLIKISNDSLGYIALEYEINPETLSKSGIPLEKISKEEFLRILEEKLTKGRLRTINKEKPLNERDSSELYNLVFEEVVEPKIVRTWTLCSSICHKEEIKNYVKENLPDAELKFRLWLNKSFLTSPQSSDALYAGIRTAILGSLWIISIAILVAFPMGIGAAIYLEEYARDKASILNRIIQVNINNLAGVPSIIYGILGLAVFVRTLEPLTSGSILGIVDPTTANGRTLLAAGLTMALLILPVIIINSQEAIKAVPYSLREASYGLGATKWQTIWHHVIPNAIPGILTGTILAMSRVIGETAPLIVIGASTYIVYDPTSVFSKFTTLPIQIYQWTSRPQAEFRNLAAAAIIVLLIILLSINALAIFLRNRYSGRLS